MSFNELNYNTYCFTTIEITNKIPYSKKCNQNYPGSLCNIFSLN